MTTKTTQSQIDSMREFCERLSADPLVKSAYVDDWGRFGNFAIFVRPTHHDRHTTARIKALARRMLKGTGAHVSAIFGPDRIRRQSYGRVTTGYSRDFWCVDVDYMRYDFSSNSFSEGNT